MKTALIRKIKNKIQLFRGVLWLILIVAGCWFFVDYPQLGQDIGQMSMASNSRAFIKYHDGSEKEVQGLEFGVINKGDEITVTVDIPQEIRSGQAVLAFGINHAVGSISYRDQMLDSYGEDIDARGDFIAHHNYFAAIPAEAMGDTVEIRLRATEDKAFNRIAKLMLYPAGDAFHFYFDLEYGRMLISCSVLLLSILTMITAVFLMKTNKERVSSLLCMSFFGLFSSQWLIIAEGIQQFFEINLYFVTTLEYVMFPLQTVPLCIYVMITEKSSILKKIQKIVIISDIVVISAASLLNYFNIAHFAATVVLSAVVLLANGALFLVSALHNMDVSIRSKRIALLGLGVLCMTGVLDILRFYLYRSTGDVSFNRIDKIFTMGVFVFFVFQLISLIIAYGERHELERKYQMKLMTSQMQPHFLYNALASIQEIVFDDPERAADTIGNFSTYLRGTVRVMSAVDVVRFSDELKNIRAYVEIEKIRFDERLTVEFDIRSDNFWVPPLSIQPIVENAIRHGIYERGPVGGTVRISSEEDSKDFIVTIEDNGTGFDVKKIIKEIKTQKRDSQGLNNMINRLNGTLNANVDIKSSIGVGTVVTVRIPKKGHERHASDNS